MNFNHFRLLIGLIAIVLFSACQSAAPTELPVVVGAAIAIERSRPLQALLRANNVAFQLTEGDRVLVAPEQSGGLMLEFMPQT